MLFRTLRNSALLALLLSHLVACSAGSNMRPASPYGDTTFTKQSKEVDFGRGSEQEFRRMQRSYQAAKTSAHYTVAQAAPPPTDVSVGSTTSGSSSSGAVVSVPGSSTPHGPSTTTPMVQVTPPKGEMLDIEARFNIEVEKAIESTAQLRKLVLEYAGTITREELQDTYQSIGTFEIRIPSDRIREFLEVLARVGQVKSRDVKATDVGKTFFDNELLLRNLEVTMARFEALLAQSKTLQETIAIEHELARLRSKIEQVKGELRFLRDRVSRSTVYVRMYQPRRDVSPTVNLEPKIYVGLRFTHMADIRGEHGSDKFTGFGLSLRDQMSFRLDFDWLSKTGERNPFTGVDAFTVAVGGDFFSDLFGGGRRKYFNPYLGFRIGYSRVDGRNDMLLVASLGLEVVKTKYLIADINLKLSGMFFGKTDNYPWIAHVGIQPAFVFNFGF